MLGRKMVGLFGLISIALELVLFLVLRRSRNLVGYFSDFVSEARLDERFIARVASLGTVQIAAETTNATRTGYVGVLVVVR